jgi:hypothetical protein
VNPENIMLSEISQKEKNKTSEVLKWKSLNRFSTEIFLSDLAMLTLLEVVVDLDKCRGSTRIVISDIWFNGYECNFC